MVMRRSPGRSCLTRQASVGDLGVVNRCRALSGLLPFRSPLQVQSMRKAVLGTLTIGHAPRPDVGPIIDRHVPASVRRIHRGVLDGMTRRDIDARYRPEPGEPALITRLHDGSAIELSRSRMRDGVEQALFVLEADGCDVILLLCTGTFDGLRCEKSWLVEPDHIIPGTVAGLIEQRQLGIIVPIAGQI